MLQQNCYFRWMVRDVFSPELSQIPLKFGVFSWNSKIRFFFFNKMSSYTVHLTLSFLWIWSSTSSCSNQAKQAEFRFSGEFQEHELIFMTLKFQHNIHVWDNIWSALSEFLSDMCSMVSHTKHELKTMFLSVGLSEKDNCLLNH